jgi:phage-related protein
MTAAHLNLSTVIDKNKIDSDKTFLFLFSADVKDSTGALITTLYFAKNSEDVQYNGNTYQAANFDIDIQIEAGQEPQITLRAQDQTRTIQSYIDLYDGMVKSTVKLLVVHEDALPDGAPEMDEDFLVIESSVNEYIVEIKLGTESAVAQRFPLYRQFKNRCAWKYKGVRCKYKGSMPTCDYTRDGSNGCIAHGNEPNFGGFPGLNDHF